jgi:hypothetical protein
MFPKMLMLPPNEVDVPSHLIHRRPVAQDAKGSIRWKDMKRNANEGCRSERED